MNLLETKNLGKKYGQEEAVRGVDLTLASGEIFALLGPNGAGKTTTLNMLTGLCRPTRGEFTFFGLDGLRQMTRIQSRLGIMPDESNLYDEMDGLANLEFCAALYGLPKAARKQKAQQLTKQFDLSGAAGKPFKAYSKGMKRKLTLAAALIHEPKVLFLDEPTTGIDVESARQIRRLIASLRQDGLSVFLTTHYIEEAERLCDRISFIVDGRIIRTDAVHVLLHEFTRDHGIQLRLGSPSKPLVPLIAEAFPRLHVEVESSETLRLFAANPINLTPIMDFFKSRDVAVYEARSLRPTLEDVFVELTGLELSVMKKEKEGRGQ